MGWNLGAATNASPKHPSHAYIPLTPSQVLSWSFALMVMGV